MLTDRQAFEAMRFVRTVAAEVVRAGVGEDEGPHDAIRFYVSVEAWELEALELEALAQLYEDERKRARLELELEAPVEAATTEGP